MALLTSVISVGVVINELFSRGTAAELDWIEIYNPTASSLILPDTKFMIVVETQ